MQAQNKYSLVELLPAVTIFVVLLLISLSMHTLAETPTDSASIFEDRDQDGLSDEEEKALGTDPLLKDSDGDSYSDGVEVESGYDPLIPAPNDRPAVNGMGGEDPELLELEDNEDTEVSATEEFTENFSDYLEESIASGKEDISVDEITAIANASVSEPLTFGQLPDISMDDILIKEQNYNNLSDDEHLEKKRQDAIEYFTGSAFILSSHLPVTPGGSTELMDVMDYVMSNMNTIGTSAPSPYLIELADTSEKALDDLKSVEVPQEYLDVHIRGLQLARYGSILGQDIEMSETDPLSTISTLSQIQGLFSLSGEYVNEMTTLLNDIKILEEEIDL